MKAPLRLAALIPAALALAPLAAQTGGFVFEAQGREGGYDVYLARDDAGRQITLLVEGDLGDAQKQALLDLRNQALGLRALRLRSARALVTAAAIDVLAVPEEYVVEGQDLTRFLPAGLRFHAEKTLTYDFRVLVGHYFLRIAGPFEGDEALGRRLLEAVRTPAAFLRADTMEYVSDKFAALDTRLGEIERRGGDALRELESSRADIAALKIDGEALRQEQSALRAEQAAARSELEAVKASLQKPAADHVDADVQALQQALGAVGADIEALRTVVVVLQSRNGNFNRRGVDREAISRLVALKRADPTLTQTDAAAALKAEGLSMSKKDIALVFGVFFVDYR